MTDANLKNCFMPLNTWFRWSTGVNLLATNKSSWKIKFYQFACLFVHFVCQIVVIDHLIRDPASLTVTLGPSNLTATKVWNAVIDYLNWTVVALFIHVTLLIVVRNRFPILINHFRHSIDLFDATFYKKQRRFSILCVIFIVILVSNSIHFLF